MNRLKYAPPVLFENESTMAVERNVALYDGHEKETTYDGGDLIITSHRMLWGYPGDIDMGRTCLALHLDRVVHVEEASSSVFGFKRSKRKVLLHLTETVDTVTEYHFTSDYNFIKLSFRDGFTNDIIDILNDILQRKPWQVFIDYSPEKKPAPLPSIKIRTGIVGIERSLQEKHKATDESISIAFQDLKQLMTMANDMVKVSNTISTKIKEKQGDITEDETIRFKSYLMSLGIDDPVTRDAYKSDNQYYKSLAREISDFLLSHVEEIGGMMALTDVFCRVNRARSLELLSPEDILNACRVMESLNLPLKLYQFSSDVKVLQLCTLDSESVAEATANLIEDRGSLSAEELSQQLGISVTLAKERLITAEKFGKCCRDDSIEGLRFYPNLFLTKQEEE